MAAEPFDAVRVAAGTMSGFERPWYIAGGWAVDLFLGEATRPHADVDIALLRRDQGALYALLDDWETRSATPGRRGRTRPWRGEWLDPPVHELHAHRDRGDPTELEFLLNESHGGLWQYRRNLRVVRPLDEIGLRWKPGVPFLSPEIVLLFKAKRPTANDRADFERLVPRLEPLQKAWLRSALTLCHPRHPWLDEL